MSDKGKKAIQFILFLGLGVFFIWYSIRDLDAEQRTAILDNIKGVAIDNRWIFLVISALIGLISVFLRAGRSILLLEPLGYNISKINSYHSVMICYIANLAFPRLGEVLRCSFIQRYEKVPFQKTFGTVVTERIVDMMSFGFVLLIALLFESDKIFAWVKMKSPSDSGLLIYNPLFLILIAGIAFVLLYFLFRKQIRKWKIYHKIKKIIFGFWSGLISVMHLKRPFLFFFYTFTIWICYYFMFYVAIFAFPEIAILGNQMWAASLSCIVVGTIGFIVSQGGLGAYPMFISGALLLYGIDKEVGLAIGWTVWTTETLLYLVGGIISLIIAPFTNPKKNNHEPLAENKE